MEPEVGLRLAALAVRLGWLRPEQLPDLAASDDPIATLTRLGLTQDDVALLRHLHERSPDVNPLADGIVAPPSESQAWDVTPPPPPLDDDATHLPSMSLATPVVPATGGDMAASA